MVIHDCIHTQTHTNVYICVCMCTCECLSRIKNWQKGGLGIWGGNESSNTQRLALTRSVCIATAITFFKVSSIFTWNLISQEFDLYADPNTHVVYVCEHVCHVVYVMLCMYVSMYVSFVCVYEWMYLCMYVWIYVCRCFCVHICIHVSIYARTITFLT